MTPDPKNRIINLMGDLEHFVRNSQIVQRDLKRSEGSRLFAIAITDAEKALCVLKAIDLDKIEAD